MRKKPKTTKSSPLLFIWYWICMGRFLGSCSGRDTGVVPVRSCQKLLLCLTEPAPDDRQTHHWPKLSPPLMVAVPPQYLSRQGKKSAQGNCSQEKGVRIWEGSNSVDTKVSAAGGAGGAAPGRLYSGTGGCPKEAVTLWDPTLEQVCWQNL